MPKGRPLRNGLLREAWLYSTRVCIARSGERLAVSLCSDKVILWFGVV